MSSGPNDSFDAEQSVARPTLREEESLDAVGRVRLDPQRATIVSRPTAKPADIARRFPEHHLMLAVLRPTNIPLITVS
ncbi:MAG: hypothetical protein QOC57_923 [Ilumatobacteraceae bacterium]